MSIDDNPDRDPRATAARIVGRWAAELDDCDAYIVVLGDPSGPGAYRTYGPYSGYQALVVAGRLDRTVDTSNTTVSVVRLHYPVFVPQPRS